MLKYFFKKLVICFLSLFLVMSVTFFLMKAIPGDPFSSEQNMPKEVLKSLNMHYGLDKPLLYQYIKYLKGFFTFDLGPSLLYEGRTVFEIIKDGLPITMMLGFEALIISLSSGLILGTIAAIKKDKWQSTFVSIFAIIGISVPNFLFASLLQYFFAMKLHLFPIARFESFLHSILPSVALASLPSAYIARLMKTSMIEVLSKDYIKTAKAKGLSTFHVIFKHAFKNAILPVVSYLGPLTAHVLTGSFVIEKIFSIPGIGMWLVSSISARDYPVIIGLSVFYSFILIIIMFFLDIIYKLIDPRIEIDNASRQSVR
ncbi:MAG: Oligopeptide transport system permease protein OppB [Candidatus Anoxychlamydiales bacterium]|nr:Oligopeptide transport system permease protein OppB [Candidatus Anoxychlamydiales bacterium]